MLAASGFRLKVNKQKKLRQKKDNFVDQKLNVFFQNVRIFILALKHVCPVAGSRSRSNGNTICTSLSARFHA